MAVNHRLRGLSRLSLSLLSVRTWNPHHIEQESSAAQCKKQSFRRLASPVWRLSFFPFGSVIDVSCLLSVHVETDSYLHEMFYP